MTPTDDPLADLCARALDGDRLAVELLCRELQGTIFRLALRMIGNPADAADATQEILLQVVTHLSQFRGESRFLTWSYTVATRHLLRSRQKLEHERSVEMLASRIRQGLAVTEPSSQPEGDVELERRETCLGCTTAMLECVSVEERMAIVLAEMLGADDTLGARLCEVTPMVYRKRLSRARQKLRPVLEDLCGLARSSAPCSCARQAKAKELAGIESSVYKRLPLVDAQADKARHVQQAMAGFSQLRALGAVFAIDPRLDPPEDIWAELQRRLPSVLGARER